ncbi:MAG TPA: Rieske (2Fe-2S) protein [Capsulimonadaceae bacterium]|jgi:cytochrome b6-f complex iron-sulfur subunit
MSEQTVEEPIEELDAEDEGVTRRGFVKVAVGGMALVYAGAVGYPIYKYLDTPVERAEEEAKVTSIALTKGEDKLAPGSALMFKFGSHPAMLIHHLDGKWVAFTAVCTHLGCTLPLWKAGSSTITCACHGGQYDPKTGKNVAGPPPRALQTYNVTVAPGVVTISKA